MGNTLIGTLYVHVVHSSITETAFPSTIILQLLGFTYDPIEMYLVTKILVVHRTLKQYLPTAPSPTMTTIEFRFGIFEKD